VGQELSQGDILEGKYTIGPRLGEGGMGVVFQAEHISLGVKVAVKVLHPSEADDSNMIARFKVEARSAAGIRHQNVVEVTDFGLTPDRRPFFVMEYLRGESLADRLDRRHTLTEREAVELADQILSGLSSAHRRGVIHRDLKPENVFLATRDEGREIVKLLDFGIAKIIGGQQTQPGKQRDSNRPLTMRGTVLGTPGYMAPETINAEESIDARADLFSVGVLLYEMLTGRRPFTGAVPHAIMSQTVSRPVPRPSAIRPDLSDAMERLILTALAKDPNDRYQTAEEFVHHLTAAAVGRVPDDARPCKTRVGMPSIAPGSNASSEALPLLDRHAVDTSQISGSGAAGSAPAAPRPAPAPRATRPIRRRAPIVVSPLMIVLLLALGGAVYYFFFYQSPMRIVEHESRTSGLPRSEHRSQPSEKPHSAGPAPSDVDTDQLGLPASVTIWLDLSPRDAVVRWDGAVVKERPLVVPGSTKPSRLRVTAKGYIPQSRGVIPDRERTFRIKLEKKTPRE
jgi:serine/threonine protein kinase